MQPDFTTIAGIIQDLFTKDLQKFGKNFITRMRKITLSAFACVVIFAVMKVRNPSFAYLAEEFATQDISITPQGGHNRFNEKSVELFRELLGAILSKINGIGYSSELPLLKMFNRVFLGDCSSFSLPDELKEEFPGCGGKNGSGQAALKMYCRMEVTSGKIADLLFKPGKTSDHTILKEAEPTPEGSLVLHDLGFYNIILICEYDEKGIYFISRVPAGKVVTKDGIKCSIGTFLTTFGEGKDIIDTRIEIGEVRHPVRLVAFRAPPEVAQIRRKKMQEKHNDKKYKEGDKPLSQEQLMACEWTVYITNLSEEEYDPTDIYTLYRVRWQIELFFKLMKSEAGVGAKEYTKGNVCLTFFYAMLIGFLIMYCLTLLKGGPLEETSPTKKLRRVREHVVFLAEAIYKSDFALLCRRIANLVHELDMICKQQSRNKDPSTRQALIAPKPPQLRPKKSK